jgi:DNA replication protein DnaC
MMEHIGDILKKIQTRTNISEENTDTWYNDEPPQATLADPGCPICKGAGFVHPRKPSGKPDFSRVISCRCVQAAKHKALENRLQKYSNLGVLVSYSFDTITESSFTGNVAYKEIFIKATEAARKYSADPRGWFILVGPSGSGKTYLAAAIANERIKHGLPAFFQTVPDLLDHLRSTFAPGSELPYDELFEQVRNAPLLILDDLGIQAGSPWAKEKLDQLLNYRFIHELPTVITTSLPVDKLDDRIRTRLLSRLSQIFVFEEKTSSLQEYAWPAAFELQKTMLFINFDYKRLNLPAAQRQNLEAAFQCARQYAESPDGWVVFQGVNGCGKTHLAAAIINYRYEQKKPALFIVVPDFLGYLRSTFSPDSKISYDRYLEAVQQAPFLVLDDFGEQAATPWAQEKLYQVLNYRYNARLSTVITTSSSLDELEARISSRLVDPKISMVINITAPDYRGDTCSNPGVNKNTFRRLKKNKWGQD